MTEKLRLSFLLAVLASAAMAGFLFVVLASKDAPASFAAFNDNSTQAAEEKADALVEEIAARPLFTPGRQKPEVKVVKAEPPVLQGRLAGVMLRPDARLALFTRPGGRPVSVKEGEVIDGWTASKIEEGRVVLTSSFGEQIVTPTNGTAEEITSGTRPAKKPAAKNQAGKKQPAKPGQNSGQNTNQKPPQLANSAAPTGKR